MIQIVAEIGNNHQGDLNTAKHMITEARRIGCEYVKFQKRDCASHKYSSAYLAHRLQLEFNYNQYQQIDTLCNQIGMPWFASAWDEPSVDFLAQFSDDLIKIPSAKITDEALLQKVAQSRFRRVMFSTGMSSMEEVDHAYQTLSHKYLIIMHCNSSYPARESELNLRAMATLKKKCPTAQIGYSGHEVGLAPTLAAAALGAQWIERHVTLSRAMIGTDHAASVEFVGMERLIRDIKAVEEALGDGVKRIYESELPAFKKLRLEEV